MIFSLILDNTLIVLYNFEIDYASSTLRGCVSLSYYDSNGVEEERQGWVVLRFEILKLFLL